MSRLIILTLALSTLSGCSILRRVETTIAELDTANKLLSGTNGQMSVMNQQMT
jgi:hypothetical protein